MCGSGRVDAKCLRCGYYTHNNGLCSISSTTGQVLCGRCYEWVLNTRPNYKKLATLKGEEGTNLLLDMFRWAGTQGIRMAGSAGKGAGMAATTLVRGVGAAAVGFIEGASAMSAVGRKVWSCNACEVLPYTCRPHSYRPF